MLASPPGGARGGGRAKRDRATDLIDRDTIPMMPRVQSPARSAPSPRSRPDPPAPVARVRLHALRGILELLEHFGVPRAAVLRTAQLRRPDFDDPARTAPFPAIDRLMETCVRRTGCNHFGLLLGQSITLQSLGVAGDLARRAASVGGALHDLIANFRLHDTGASPIIAVHDDRATMSYVIHAVGVRNASHVHDLAAAAMLNVLRELCGPDWQPGLVLLPRRRPADLRPYREVLGARLRFDAAQAAVVFPAAWLAQPVAGADAGLHARLAAHAAQVMDGDGPPLHDEVRRVIRIRMISGRCSRESVARDLGLHPRTLGRRLQATGTTFQALLDQTRAQLASQLLRDTRLPIARIASKVGYRDATVFTRAFRRWIGGTPRSYRAALPAEPAGP